MTKPQSRYDPRRALTVGRILAPHGLRGDVKVEPLTDFPERFAPGAVVWLRDQPVRVERCRWQGPLAYLKLAGTESRTAAEGLRGAELKAPPAEALEAGVYYAHDIIGLEVRNGEGRPLGKITDILRTGANDVYVVRGPEGELLLPALDDVVLEVRPEAGYLVVDVPEGLAFSAGPKRQPPRLRRRARQSPSSDTPSAET